MVNRNEEAIAVWNIVHPWQRQRSWTRLKDRSYDWEILRDSGTIVNCSGNIFMLLNLVSDMRNIRINHTGVC